MVDNYPGKLKIAANYRVVQPIENFKLRVKIVQQKSLLAELFDTEGETRDSNFLEIEERVFSWQEKVFSPFETTHYRDEKNCFTDTQKKYHEILVNRENDEESRLFTYTQEDYYYRSKCPLTGSYRSPLSDRNENALPSVQNRKPFSERYNKQVVEESPSDTRIRANHYLYKDQSTMYILADLSSKNETLGASPGSEILLCTITYDKISKILKIDPDFTNDDCYTVETLGMGYNYWIEHASEQRTVDGLQREKENLRREIQERRAYREAEIFEEIPLPPNNVLRVFLNLDLISARGFPYDSLFITYQIDLPKHWSTRDRERLTGRTQRCRMTRGTAHFSYVTEIIMDFDLSCLNKEENVQPSWPYLLLSVASLDSWTRYRIEGYASIPLPPSPGRHTYELHTWRPVCGFVNALRRFFTGGNAEIEDMTYCGIPESHEGPRLEKTRLNVVPSGMIEINLNVAHQSKMFTKNRGFRREAFERLSAGTLIHSLDNVLEQFKAARERMLQARAMNL